MTLEYYIADVFTNQRFAGAQVAVFPKADDLNDQQMTQIANELNLPETVFVSNSRMIKQHEKCEFFHR